MTPHGWVRLPTHAPGQKIGLLGGSFDPAHDGHRTASLLALRRLKLDWVWWLVSPGNPLKDTQLLAPLDVRLAIAREVAHHPQIEVTDLEASIGTRFTYDTISMLKRRAGQCHFVWLMGADNLSSFHRWKRWRDIANLVPLAIIDRPGSTLKASRVTQALGAHRVDEINAPLLPLRDPPAYVVLHGRRSPLSSTEIRAKSEQ